MVQVRVEVRLKKGVTDPEGDNVQKALTLLGFKGLRDIHSSKLFLIDLATEDPRAAQKQAEEKCSRLLATPVIHDYSMLIGKNSPRSSCSLRTGYIQARKRPKSQQVHHN